MSTLKNHGFIGTWHIKTDYARQLYKETDFKNSSLGGFRAQGWQSAANPSNIGYNTTDGYIYSTNSHSQIQAAPPAADYSIFNDSAVKAVKIVCDGLLIGNNNSSYSTNVGLCSMWFNKKSSGYSSNVTRLSGSDPVADVWYKAEIILERGKKPVLTLEDCGVFTITDDSVTFEYLVSQESGRWFTTGNIGYSVFYLNLDQGTTSKLKDIHVYLGY